jgi:hypothetical protein
VHPPSLSELQCLVSQIKPVLDHIRPKIEINVGVELFKQLQAEVEMGGSEDLSGWGGSRYYRLSLFTTLRAHTFYSIDYDGKVLIVECGPSIGHEIISDIFHQLSANGASYPRHTGHGTTISQGGSAAVDLTKGMKEPDFSLYETRPLNSDLDNTANSKPTIAWEVAYSESEKKLTTDAARLICLSRCGVLLVVALNIDISGTRESRQLNSVTWSHWEMDALGSEEIAPGKEVRTGKLGILEPDCGDGANIPVAYRAIVAKKDGQISVRAAVTEKYVVCASVRKVDLKLKAFRRLCPMMAGRISQSSDGIYFVIALLTSRISVLLLFHTILSLT